MRVRKLALAPIAAAVMAVGSPAYAAWTGSFSDMGVNYTLSDLTVGSSITHTYSLLLVTAGYNHHATPAFLDSVDIKAWGDNAGPSNVLTFTFSAPAGSSWSAREGPISSGPVGNTGCGSGTSGFACLEAVTKGVYSVLSGPYTFGFTVTAAHASDFLTSAVGAHVGAGYANSEIGRAHV